MQKLIFSQTNPGAGKWLLLFAALILGALVNGNAMALNVTVTGIGDYPSRQEAVKHAEAFTSREKMECAVRPFEKL